MFCKCFVLIGPPNNKNCILAEQLVKVTYYSQINILSPGRCQKHKRYNYPILRPYFPLVEQLVKGTHYSQINIMSAYRCQNHKRYTYPSLGSYFPLSVDVCGRYTVHYTYQTYPIPVIYNHVLYWFSSCVVAGTYTIQVKYILCLGMYSRKV